jgi:uncharacterized protein YbjT (DUF2867 family)
LVRDAAKARFAPGVENAVGDVLALGSLKTALAGQEAVICSLGSAATGPFKEMTLLSTGTAAEFARQRRDGHGQQALTYTASRITTSELDLVRQSITEEQYHERHPTTYFASCLDNSFR